MALSIITQGSFKSTGVPVNISVQQGADYFKTVNMTQLAATQTTAVGVQFEWYSNPTFPTGGAIEWAKADDTHNGNFPTLLSSGGFTYYTAYPIPQAAFVGTAITNATPAVASGFTNLPYNSGDTVYLYNTVGMAQIGGMRFTIYEGTPSTTTFTLPGLPAAGFSTAATAVTARRAFPLQPVIPEALFVTAITQATQAQVTVSEAATTGTYTDGTGGHSVITGSGMIYVGQKLVFQIPQSFGMVQLNTNNLPGTQDLPAIVTSVIDAFNFTINVNTTNFTAFAFPASSGSPTTPLFATVAPAGSSTQFNPQTMTYTGYDINRQPFRSSADFPIMNLQAGVNSPAGASGDVIVWTAWKDESNFYASNA